MSYSDLIQKLYSVSRLQGVKFGLDNILKLTRALGNPQNRFLSIHVAGSNGKGSVSTKIAAAYESTGKKVGLYTSPHIATFRERISINDQMIEEEEILELLPPIFALAEKLEIPATFFEITTALGFLYFAKKNVDIAVLETGLGGRLDATNVVTPLLSIITSVSLEHTDLLGETREEIAREKAGIIKENIPVLIGPFVPYDSIAEIARLKNSPLTQVKDTFTHFNEENNAIARKALSLLHVDIPHVEKGLQIRPSCRFEEHVVDGKTILFDVAHNPDGLMHLFKALESSFPSRPFRVVVGLSSNKDLFSCLSCIQRNACAIHLVSAETERAATVDQLSQVMKKLQCIAAPLKKTIAETLHYAIHESTSSEIIVVCGTFFIMKEALAAIGVHKPSDPLPVTEIFTTEPTDSTLGIF